MVMVTCPVVLVLMSRTVPRLPSCVPPTTLHCEPSFRLLGCLAFIFGTFLRAKRLITTQAANTGVVPDSPLSQVRRAGRECSAHRPQTNHLALGSCHPLRACTQALTCAPPIFAPVV